MESDKLLVTNLYLIYMITYDVLCQVFDPYGCMDTIEIHSLVILI